MKRMTKKLAFEKQTVRMLTKGELAAAAGGYQTQYCNQTYRCQTGNCQTGNCQTGTCQPTITAYQTGCDSGDYTMQYC